MATTTVAAPLPAAARATALARAHALSTTGRGRAIRLATGVSLQVIAEATGTAASTISRWERGACRVTGDAAIRWAQLLAELEPLTRDAS